MKYKNGQSNYDKYPEILVSKTKNGAFMGYEDICNELNEKLRYKKRSVIAIDCYVGVYEEELLSNILHNMDFDKIIFTKDIFYDGEKLTEMMKGDLTEDRVFGKMTNMKLCQLIDEELKVKAINEINNVKEGKILIIGLGATLIYKPDIQIYADLARWEIQLRYRSKKLGNYKAENYEEDFLKKYKRAYFIEWRLADSYKKEQFDTLDYLLDTNETSCPKMITGDNFRKALELTVSRPFRVVPFFDPGVWGGQWLKEICDLDKEAENFAWCFDCVPEENSLLLRFGDIRIEIPSIDVVLYRPKELIGEKVFNRFGAEFPIRFDMLDTMGGENLSLQVHPLKSYIKEKFNMEYTQDESYYILDAGEDAVVYLGLKEGIDKDEFIKELKKGQSGEKTVDVEKYINKWETKKHDHFLIPNGTVHCSGADSMVLEISATPYIFTFKLWDWGRVGLDGIPRPIHIEHGEKVIQFNRTTEWVRNNLVNRTKVICDEKDILEEATGLHELEFIETRRHWFNKKVIHNTNNTVNVLNLIEGDEAIVESINGNFHPFIVHYAETFIIPAAVGEYSIAPYGASKGKTIGTIKAYVRGGVI